MHLRRLALFLNSLLFAGFIISGCKNTDVKINDSAQVEHHFVQKLQKDSLIFALNKIQGELDLADASNKFNLLHYNKEMIARNEKKCKTSGQLIALYKKAGITHAREYYALTWSRVGVIMLLQRKYPELYKLPRSERLKVFEAVIKPDVSTVAIADSAEKYFHK